MRSSPYRSNRMHAPLAHFCKPAIKAASKRASSDARSFSRLRHLRSLLNRHAAPLRGHCFDERPSPSLDVGRSRLRIDAETQEP
jgi:hypothetical protein